MAFVHEFRSVSHAACGSRGPAGVIEMRLSLVCAAGAAKSLPSVATCPRATLCVVHWPLHSRSDNAAIPCLCPTHRR